MSTRIEVPDAALKQWCHRHAVRRMAFFGSVLRDDFTAQSDVDVLMEFEPGTRVGLIALAGMEIDLSRILGHRVEIHTVKGLNPLFRDEVLSSAEVHYEHA
jgi:predicted nucleotidyltransferase